MLNIEFQDCPATVFGGHSVTIRGRVAVAPQSIGTIMGSTGSGKTMLLAVIAHFFGCPAFRAIDTLNRSKLIADVQIDAQHVGIVRQSPVDNFLGNCVGEEIELSFGVSRLTRDEFRRRLEELWSAHFGEDLSILTRQPDQISSGQQQILSILTQVLRNPDLLLADEPLARLSVVNARRVLELLGTLPTNTYILLSTHRDALQSVAYDGVLLGPHHSVQVTDTTLMTVTHTDIDLNSHPPTLSENEAGLALIDWSSYQQELQYSQHFSILPDRTLRTVVGSGKRLTAQGLNIDVFMDGSRSPAAFVRGLDLRGGINVLYGDNGAGKTLIGRALGGDISLNPWMTSLRRAYATGASGNVTPEVAGSGVSGGTTIGRLQRARRCHFLSSIPDEVLTSVGTIDQEYRDVYVLPDDIESRRTLIIRLGLDPERHVEELSFGERKLVAFSLLRNYYSLLVLDELFVNMADATQLLVASHVIRKCRSGDWAVVVMTSNRPETTLDILRRASLTIGLTHPYA